MKEVARGWHSSERECKQHRQMVLLTVPPPRGIPGTSVHWRKKIERVRRGEDERRGNGKREEERERGGTIDIAWVDVQRCGRTAASCAVELHQRTTVLAIVRLPVQPLVSSSAVVVLVVAVCGGLAYARMHRGPSSMGIIVPGDCRRDPSCHARASSKKAIKGFLSIFAR